MKPRRAKLKWAADQWRSKTDGGRYWLIKLLSGRWSSGSDDGGSFQGSGPFVTKRAAILACEKHAMENGRKSK